MLGMESLYLIKGSKKRLPKLARHQNDLNLKKRKKKKKSLPMPYLKNSELYSPPRIES